MRVSEAMGMIMLASFVFIVVGFLISDFETAYVETNISEAEPFNKTLGEEGNATLPSAEDVEDNFLPLQEHLETFAEASGIKDVLGSGFVVVWHIFAALIGLFPLMWNWANNVITVFATQIGLPPNVLRFIMVGVIVWFLFKAINLKRQAEPA